MKLTACRSSVAFFMYSAVVLVIVNGQPTTEDVDTDEVAELRAELDKALARIDKLEAAAVERIDGQQDASETNSLT